MAELYDEDPFMTECKTENPLSKAPKGGGGCLVM